MIPLCQLTIKSVRAQRLGLGVHSYHIDLLHLEDLQKYVQSIKIYPYNTLATWGVCVISVRDVVQTVIF